MNWVETSWTMMIAASLMLGIVHLFVWQKRRSQYANLLFFVLAVSAAAYGAYELARMQAETPADLAVNGRWSHVPLAVFVISTVGFVRRRDGETVIGLWLAALALNAPGQRRHPGHRRRGRRPNSKAGESVAASHRPHQSAGTSSTNARRGG